MKDLTSRYWQQKRKGPALRIALTFKILLLAALSNGGPFQTLEKSSPNTLLLKVQHSGIKEEQLRRLSNLVSSSKSASARRYALDSLRSYISARARLESPPSNNFATEQIRRIKSSPMYRDEQVQSANWFAKGAEDLWNMIARLFKSRSPDRKKTPTQLPGLFGTWLTYAMWAILATLVCTFAFFALRHARWRIQLRHRSKALLEEDEPERSVDEWLVRADELEAEGQYREAVRCLYLACLLRFDEARIARFDRGQTNWEHLGRIRASHKLPKEIDFQPATQAFDRIWYGMRGEGRQDVERFRSNYVELTRSLSSVAP